MGQIIEFFDNINDIYNGWNLNSLESINSYLSYEPLVEKREKWDHYNFNGISVPRVTEILGATIARNYLMKYAAKLGDSYEKQNQITLDTGTLVHAMLEDYIITGKPKASYDVSNPDQMKALKSYHNITRCLRDIENMGYKITPIFNERPIVTPWFGGTVDFCAGITGPNAETKTFILDFKTSMSISVEYFIQTYLYAYGYMFLKYNDLDGFGSLPDVNGIGVIRGDKEQDKYEYIFVDIQNDRGFVDYIDYAAFSMLDYYYKYQGLDINYKAFRKEYINRGGINGLYK